MIHLVKATFHYATQLASWSQTARELDSVMEFGLQLTLFKLGLFS